MLLNNDEGGTSAGLLWNVLHLSILIYYIFTISFRLCFCQPYDIYSDVPAAIIFDYFCDIILIVWWIVDMLKNAKVAPIPIVSSSERAAVDSLPSSRSILVWLISSGTVPKFLKFVGLVPFELLAYGAGIERYYALRCFRLIHLIDFSSIWGSICKWLRAHDKLTSEAVLRVYFLMLVMAIVGHVAACLFYRVGLQEVKSGNDRNWLVRDNLVQMTSSGYVFLKPVSMRYLRAMYWSIQTLDTVGFGDVVAFSESETWFCICYFYTSGFLIYYSIANLMTVVTNLDSSHTNNLIQKTKFNNYALYRKLPITMINRVHSYYDYQWKILKGVNELSLLAELSPSFTQQVKQHLLRDRLQKLDEFRELGKGVLSLLSDNMEVSIFSPNDTIVEHESRVSGAYVIGSGQVEIFNVQNESLEIRKEGGAFGLAALHKSYTSLHLYKSRSFSEIFFLRGSIYRYICERYMTQYEWKDLQVKNEVFASSSASVANGKRGTMLTRNSRIMHLNVEGDDLLTVPNHAVPKSHILVPQSLFRNIWDSLFFCVLLFYLTTTALLLATSLHQQFVSNVLPLLIASYIVDGFVLVDFILSSLLFQFNEDGIIITSSEKIWTEYWRNNNIYLVFLSVFSISNFCLFLFALSANANRMPSTMPLNSSGKRSAAYNSESYYINTVSKNNTEEWFYLEEVVCGDKVGIHVSHCIHGCSPGSDFQQAALSYIIPAVKLCVGN